jgi:cell division protease FtsH
VGASQDLKEANDLARRMVGNFGMGTRLKTFYRTNDENPFLGRTLATSGSGYDSISEKTKEAFDNEVRQLVNQSFNEAVDMIESNRGSFLTLTRLLIDNTFLGGDFVVKYVEDNREE